MPGLNGLELQRTLEQQASALPIVFLTGRGDIATSVQAMKRGAADFLTKPVDDTELIAAIREALAKDRHAAPRARSASASPGAWRRSPRASGRFSNRSSPAAEQADRRRTGHRREDDQVPSRQPDAQDGRACRRRSGQAGRDARASAPRQAPDIAPPRQRRPGEKPGPRSSWTVRARLIPCGHDENATQRCWPWWMTMRMCRESRVGCGTHAPHEMGRA